MKLAKYIQLPLIRTWEDINFIVVMLNCLICIPSTHSSMELYESVAEEGDHKISVSQFEIVHDAAADPESIEAFESKLNDVDILAIFEQFPLSSILAQCFSSFLDPNTIPEAQSVLSMFAFVTHLVRLLSKSFNDDVKSKFTVVTQFVAKQISEVKIAYIITSLANFDLMQCLKCVASFWHSFTDRLHLSVHAQMAFPMLQVTPMHFALYADSQSNAG